MEAFPLMSNGFRQGHRQDPSNMKTGSWTQCHRGVFGLCIPAAQWLSFEDIWSTHFLLFAWHIRFGLRHWMDIWLGSHLNEQRNGEAEKVKRKKREEIKETCVLALNYWGCICVVNTHFQTGGGVSECTDNPLNLIHISQESVLITMMHCESKM